MCWTPRAGARHLTWLSRCTAAPRLGWEPVGEGVTDDDGRCRTLAPADLQAAIYRLVFDTGAYFAASGQKGFYPEVSIVFEVTEPTRHHHVPLLLSPFAYSTYRGS